MIGFALFGHNIIDIDLDRRRKGNGFSHTIHQQMRYYAGIQ